MNAQCAQLNWSPYRMEVSSRFLLGVSQLLAELKQVLNEERGEARATE